MRKRLRNLGKFAYESSAKRELRRTVLGHVNVALELGEESLLKGGRYT
jgi:hypothetical protein